MTQKAMMSQNNKIKKDDNKPINLLGTDLLEFNS